MVKPHPIALLGSESPGTDCVLNPGDPANTKELENGAHTANDPLIRVKIIKLPEKSYQTSLSLKDRDAGMLHFNIFLGQQVQIIEFDCLKAYDFGPNATDDVINQALVPLALAQ